MKKLVTIALLCAMLLSCFAGCGMQKGEIAVADTAVVENVAGETEKTDYELLRENVAKAKAYLDEDTTNDPTDFAVSEWDGKEDTSWYKEDQKDDEGYFLIDDAADLAGFRKLLKEGNSFTGEKIKLTTSIDLGGEDFDGFAGKKGSKATYFEGTLEGGNNVICNFTVTISTANSGFLGRIKNGAVQNFAIVGVECKIDASSQLSGVAPIFGAFNNASAASNVYSDATITVKGSNLVSEVGGLFGGATNPGDKTLTNCEFAGSIELNGASANFVGGIMGRRNKADGLTFTNCLNSGTINAPEAKFVGGILGGQNAPGDTGTVATVAFENCSNTGNITGNEYVGGMVGRVSDGSNVDTTTLTLSKCVNSATVTAKNNVGGLIGAVRANELVLDTCEFSGNIVATFDTVVEAGLAAGGLIGDLYFYSEKLGIVDTAKATLTGCTVTGALTVDRYVYNNGNDKVSLSVAKNGLADVTITDLATTEGTLTDTLHSTMVGYQESAVVDGIDGEKYYALRMVAAVDISEAVKAAGFTVTVNYKTEAGKQVKIEDKTVYAKNIYKSVKGTDADGKDITYAAETYGADYLYTLVIENIPAGYTVADGTLEVFITPFTTEANPEIPENAEKVDLGLQIQHGKIS